MTGSEGRDSRRLRWVAAGALLSGGVLAGMALGGVLGAGSADPPVAPAASTGGGVQAVPAWWGYGTSGTAGTAGTTDDAGACSWPAPAAVPAATAARVRDAVLARYPGATVGWIRADGAGGWVAYAWTSGGEHVAVQLDASFAVTGTTDVARDDDLWPDGGLPADTAARVREAVLARYPGATVWRVQPDGSGGYVAYADTKPGESGADDVVVHLDRSFAVTSTGALPSC